jgi:DNA-binding MarR family transcriptional regulator
VADLSPPDRAVDGGDTPTHPGGDRTPTRWSIIDALRRYGTDSARLGHAFAALHSLQPADLQALVAIMSAEGTGTPLTPSALRQNLGLSSGGTSLVIDRLQQAGHVRRVRDQPTDNRIVHLRYTDQGMATGLAFFGPLGDLTHAVMNDFDPIELATIARFLTAAAAALHGHLDDIAAAAAVPPPDRTP